MAPQSRSYHSFFHSLVLEFRRFPEFGVLISTLVVAVFFSFFSTQFLTLENIGGIFAVVAEMGILTIGASLLLISGEFDLSVSANYATCAATLAILTVQFQIDAVLAFLVACSVGLGIGLFNGFIRVRSGIPSFITTMGVMFFLRGFLLIITGGFPITKQGQRIPFLDLINGPIAGGDFRTSAIWLILLAIVVAVILTRHTYGNWVFATGGNVSVARALGINVNRVKLINFGICGLFAGFGGCVAFSRFNSVTPSQGYGMELEAIAATVMGGTLLSGGQGSIIGATIGAILIGMIRTGLILAGAPPYWYTAFLGMILVSAAYINLKVYKAR